MKNVSLRISWLFVLFVTAYIPSQGADDAGKNSRADGMKFTLWNPAAIFTISSA